MVKAMDEKRLREIYGPAKEKAAAKILEKLDKHCVSFIENSSFVIIGTQNNQSIDLSPKGCLLYTSPSPRDMRRSRMPSSA